MKQPIKINKFVLFASFITTCVIIFIGCIIVHNINAKNEREQALVEDSIRIDEARQIQADVSLLSLKIPAQDIDSNKIDLDLLQEIQVLTKDKPEFNSLHTLVSNMIKANAYDYDGSFTNVGTCPVTITMKADGPSCVNGWDVYPTITNRTDKTIKYVYFDIIGHNAVGDPVKSDYGSGVKWTGPVKAHQKVSGGYYTMYMESDMLRSKFEAKNITVEFIDGTKYTNDPLDANTKIADNFRDIANKCMEKYIDNNNILYYEILGDD